MFNTRSLIIMQFVQEELPYYAEVSSHVSQNIEMLYDLNHGQRISDIDIAWPEIKGKVEQASLLSSQLSAKMLDLSQEQKHLQSTVQEELEWLCRIKDKLYLCDDVSGDDQAIIDRYTDCKVWLTFLCCLTCLIL